MVTDAEVTVSDLTEGTGADIDTETVTINNKTVHRQRVRLAGESATDLAPVKQIPESGDYGLIVKDPEATLYREYAELQSLNLPQPYERDNLPTTKANLITIGCGLR